MLLSKVFFCKNRKIEQRHVQKKVVQSINFTTY